MRPNTVETMMFVFALVVVCVLLIYSGLPNLWVRVLHRSAVRTLPSTQDSRKKRVVLSFDDGPDMNYTPRLLDALGQAGIRATFFVIATKALANPELVQRMVSEGHDIQVHGYRHLMVPFLSPKATVRQVILSSQLLHSRLGVRTKWYRPTWGLCNLVTLLSPGVRTHRLVTWSVMVGDWKRTPSDILLKRIQTRMTPGAIIVLHDSDETVGADKHAPECVIELIPQLARQLREDGYEFITLSAAMPE